MDHKGALAPQAQFRRNNRPGRRRLRVLCYRDRRKSGRLVDCDHRIIFEKDGDLARADAAIVPATWLALSFHTLDAHMSHCHDTKLEPMSSFFTRERFGSAQFIAGIILLAFLGQCIWFCSRVPLSDRETATVLQGQRQWRAGEISFHEQASPITGLLASLPLLSSHPSGDEPPASWRWLARLPFMIIGALFGASIWYVAR